MKRFVILANLIILSLGSQASDLPAQWLKLLHYQKNSMGQERSLITDSSFFLHKNGAERAQLEFESNKSSFQSDQSYSCHFPARALFLSEFLNKPYEKCKNVETWKTEIGAETIALVFVSQYNSNPASVFGHSFMLFKNEAKPLYLSQTISNAALMPEEISGYDYVTKGLLGKFPAKYSQEDFYIKIQEYTRIENRDIWVFDLDSSAQQRDQLLNHLWELSLLQEPYFFMNRNCSFHIYNALAAVTDLDFVESALYVLPITTIKKSKALIKKVEFIPSQRRNLAGSLQGLSKNKLQELKNKIEREEISDDPELAPPIVNYYEYFKSRNQGNLSQSQKKVFEHSLWVQSKNQTPKSTDPRIESSPPSPLLSMPTWRIAAGNIQNSKFLSFSPGYHSLLDSKAGFLPFSEIILFNFNYDLEQKQLSTINLFSVSNFVDSSFFSPQWSWQAQLNSQPKGQLDGEFNLGKSLSFESWNLYLLSGLSRLQSQEYGLQAKAGLLLSFGPVQSKIETKAFRPSLDRSSETFELGLNLHLPDQISIETSSVFSQLETKNSIQVGYYF